ncbi:carbohydrate ABC transporter permease [Butyrivibrio sp.]|uniref:carbohydrate ABC transporter permease n=1 Tax=Butyrivibrio sp. TaxID=28121 RepID=UPI0025BD0358|nr:carbohydrate ABC transporter permease [Butyrivibrio sp.]
MNKAVSYSIKRLFLIIISFLSVFPFLWMVISATNDSADIMMGKLTFGRALLKNIRNAIESANLGRSFINSTLLSVVITILSLFICSLAGYAFVIYKNKATEVLCMIIVASMMVPFAAKIIPLYRMFANMGLLNNYLCIILPAIGAPFLVFFFRQNSESFPKETIEAARVDGCNEWIIFTSIYFPMMRSTYAAAAIFSFMAAWNNYMWPLIALQSESKYTLPLAVSNLANGFTPDYGMVMVGIIISTAPTILIFFILQKNFVEGILGSVK